MTTERLGLAVLGPLRAWRGEQPVDLGPVRQQAFLAALVLRPDVLVSRQELLDSVWGSEPPATGGKVVPVYVHRLRRCLRAEGADPADSVIVSDRGGYRFAHSAVWLDSTRLAELVAEAAAAEQAGDLAAAVDAYAGALELFHGEPLAGLPGPFAEGQRRRLAERRTTLSQEKLKRQLWLGRHAEAIGELSELTQAHPHSEALAALLMRALYLGGRRADALAVFTRLRHRLVDDLGLEPGTESRRVHQAVLRGDDGFLGAAAPPRRVRNELPADVGVLAGRDSELASLTARTDAAVVAVDGVAGAGKTALAVRAAHLLSERYPDGCLFVDLRGHREDGTPVSPQRALRRLLRTVGFGDGAAPDDLDELVACWRTATAPLRLLLVLDDAASAQQTRPLLPAGPGSRVLVTSRRRLVGLDVAHRVSLGALDADAADGLLGRIVGASRADREPAAVHELARLCGRLPLALRIAAARLQNRPMWTFEYLATRLADDERRLGELTAEDRSVEAALRLSYDQLPAAQRRAFHALGQCPTVAHDRLTLAAMLDCPPDEAERVLEELVDVSLVQQPTAGRYRLHDLVAVYARHVSAEIVDGARTRMLRLYVAAARLASDWGVSDSPKGPELGVVPFTGWQDAAAWLDAAGGELVDVVAHAAATGQVNDACWLAEGMVEYLTRQGRYHECRAALEIALPLVEQSSDPRMASALRTGFGIAYGMQGHYERARPWMVDALKASLRTGDLREQARALAGLGTIARALGKNAEAVFHLTEVLNLARGLPDDWLTGLAVTNLGEIHHQLGWHEQAWDCLAQGLALADKLGNPRAIAMGLGSIGTVYLNLGKPAEAAVALRRAVEFAEQVSDFPLYAHCLTKQGTAEEGMGNLAAAVELHHRALAVLTDQTSAGLEMDIRNRLGASLLAAGEPVAARQQFELVLAIPEGNLHPGERARATTGLERCEPPDPT